MDLPSYDPDIHYHTLPAQSSTPSRSSASPPHLQKDEQEHQIEHNTRLRKRIYHTPHENNRAKAMMYLLKTHQEFPQVHAEISQHVHQFQDMPLRISVTKALIQHIPTRLSSSQHSQVLFQLRTFIESSFPQTEGTELLKLLAPSRHPQSLSARLAQGAHATAVHDSFTSRGSIC